MLDNLCCLCHCGDMDVNPIGDGMVFTYMRDGTKGVVFYAGETRIGSWSRRNGLSWASLQMRAAVRVASLNDMASRIGTDQTIAEFKAGRA